MKTSVLVLLMFALSIPVYADDDKDKEARERIYNTTFDLVWSAAVETASKEFKVDSSDKNSGVLVFHSGRSLMSQSFNITATITSAENKTTIRLKLEIRDGGYTMIEKNKVKAAKKFLDGVEKRLKRS